MHTALLRFVRAVAGATLLGACVSAPAPQLSASAVVLETPLVEQDALWECGLASVSALCSYHGVALSPAARAQLAATAAERHGLSGDELSEVLRKLGFEVFVFAGTLDREATGLLRHVDAGRPTLVMTSERGSEHYGLFIGYDPERNDVVLLDPVRGRVVLPSNAFAALWERTGRFTLLALPFADDTAAQQDRP